MNVLNQVASSPAAVFNRPTGMATQGAFDDIRHALFATCPEVYQVCVMHQRCEENWKMVVHGHGFASAATTGDLRCRLGSSWHLTVVVVDDGTLICEASFAIRRRTTERVAISIDAGKHWTAAHYDSTVDGPPCDEPPPPPP